MRDNYTFKDINTLPINDYNDLSKKLSEIQNQEKNEIKNTNRKYLSKTNLSMYNYFVY